MAKIYKVSGSITIQTPDLDGVLGDEDVDTYNNFYTSKVNAIAMAQRLFAKGIASWVYVLELTIGEHGVENSIRIYNKYKKS